LAQAILAQVRSDLARDEHGTSLACQLMA